ncbi:MAG: hypothetical protein ACK5QH_03290 [Rubrivivax sp.]|jgi:hypothetical protein
MAVCALLFGAIGQPAWPQTPSGTVDIDRVPTPALEAHCRSIPDHAHVSGEVDGGWGQLLPGVGRTYYQRSRCYMELVRRTGRVELCPLVVKRRSLLGDGSAYTPERCEAVGRDTQARMAQEKAAAAAHAALIQGRFVLGPVSASVLPSGDWRLQTLASGQRPGPYRVQVLSGRDRRVLVEQSLDLQHDTPLQWTLPRASVVGQAPLPDIFPVVVVLEHPMPPDAQGRVHWRLSSIQNITLSAMP